MIQHHTLLHTRAYWAGNIIKLEDVSEPLEFGRMGTLNLYRADVLNSRSVLLNCSKNIGGVPD